MSSMSYSAVETEGILRQAMDRLRMEWHVFYSALL